VSVCLVHLQVYGAAVARSCCSLRSSDEHRTQGNCTENTNKSVTVTRCACLLQSFYWAHLYTHKKCSFYLYQAGFRPVTSFLLGCVPHPFLPLPLPFSSFLSPFSFPSPPLFYSFLPCPSPQIPAREYGERCKLPQRVPAEPGRQAHFGQIYANEVNKFNECRG